MLKMRKQRHGEMTFLIQCISSDCHNKVPSTGGGGFTNRDVLSHSFGGWRSKIKYQHGRVLERALFLPCTELHSCCVPTWQRERELLCFASFFKSITCSSVLHTVASYLFGCVVLNCGTQSSLWCMDSVVVANMLSSCGVRAHLLHGTWDINSLTRH